MKKLILTLLLVATAAFAFSQDVNFGIKAGLNLSTQTGDPYSDNKILPGFNAGVVADIGLHDFSIQPGIIFTTKGEKISVDLVNASDVPSGTAVTTTTLNYIEVPINFLYHATAAPGVKIYFGGGTYFAYGPGGTVSGNSVGGSNFNEPVNFKNETNANTVSYKNPDIGVNLLVGLLINKKYSFFHIKSKFTTILA